MSAITLERIKELCDRRNISVSKLESDLGFGVNSIYKWKVSDPRSSMIKKVAEYLGVSVDYLLGSSDIISSASAILSDESFIALQRARQNMPEKDWNQAMDIIRAGFKYAFEENE